MKPSEIFNNMDEVRAYAASMRASLDDEAFDTLLFVLGLCENEGMYETVVVDGQEVNIDRSIAPLIIMLNNKGLHTLACCSGIQSEHMNAKHDVASGYISFRESDETWNKMSAIADQLNLQIEKSECFLQPSILIRIKGDDDKKQEVFDWIYTLVESQ